VKYFTQRGEVSLLYLHGGAAFPVPVTEGGAKRAGLAKGESWSAWLVKTFNYRKPA